MVVLYSWSSVRDISWSRVRVMVLTCCGVMVIVFTIILRPDLGWQDSHSV